MKSWIKPSFPYAFSFLLWTLLSLSPRVFGAACCGGSVAAPFLILGDDRAQMSVSYSHNVLRDEVGSDGLWRRRDSGDIKETMNLEGGHIFADRWQAGFQVPVVRRSQDGRASSGLGDVVGVLGYEFLPQWEYSPWRPKGHGFLQITLPTGRSIYESETHDQIDARGRGFFAVGLGTVLSKIKGPWDMNASFDLHRSFARRFSNSQTEGELKPGYGGNLGLGAGWNRGRWRAGGSVTSTYEDPLAVSGTIDSSGSAERFTTAALSGSCTFPEGWSVTVTYSDQTLFGHPVNATLGRGITIASRKAWLR